MKELESRAMKSKLPFEFNKLYKLWINSEYILLNEDTINIIIKSIITEYILSGKGAKTIDVVSLLNDIEWQWMTNRGSLSKRIGKWLKQKYDIAITSELSTAIGNTARKFLLKDQTYYFDFADKVNWNAGEFGDHSSCFWYGTRVQHRTLQKISNDETMCAIRLFKQHSTASGYLKVPDDVYYVDKEHYYKGISRAWMSIDKYQDSRVLTIFNGYGLTTVQIAALVSSFLGMSTQRLIINNNGDVEGDLYVNDFGVAIGDNSVIKKLVEYDVNLSGSGRFYEKKTTPKEDATVYRYRLLQNRRRANNSAGPQPGFIKNLRGKPNKSLVPVSEVETPFTDMLTAGMAEMLDGPIGVHIRGMV